MLAVPAETARILIADDHPLIRLAVRQELAEADFEVCAEAGDGPSAVAAAVRLEPDLCLLDLHMPGGGLETTRKIKRRFPHVKVVVLTACEDENEMLEVILAGASGLLGKDTDPARLPHVLHAVLQGELAVPRALVGKLVERLLGDR